MIGHGARMDRRSRRSCPTRSDPQYPPLGAGLELRRGARAGAAGHGSRSSRRSRSPTALRERGMMDESRPRAVEAALFAAEDAAERRRYRRLCRRGRRRRRRWPSSPSALCRARRRAGRARRALAFPDRARPRPYPAPRARGEPRRLSRAATETLAIIAYHEPVSRAEIEAIRGVQISQGHARRADGGGLGAAGRAARGAGAAACSMRPRRNSSPISGSARRRDLPGIDDLKAAGLLDPVDEARLRSFNWKVTTRRTK